MARILLVDDDVDLIEVNRINLEGEGHEVSVAYSGAEALEVLADADPDVAVLDVMMEDKTAGFKLAREVHAMMPEVRILMLTGIRREEALKYVFEPDETWLPVAKFIEKPISPSELAREIAAVLAS